VYVPYYDPRFVYGTWGYPNYPPIYFPPPPNYGYVAGPGIYFGIGFGIIDALWGWDQWDWGGHDIHIDADRYNRIDNYTIVHDHRPPYAGNTWQHDSFHRRGVPYSSPTVRQRFQPAAAAAANARRDFRGFDNRGAAPAAAPRAAAAGRPGAAQQAQRSPPGAQRPGEAARPGPASRPEGQTPQTNARAVTPQQQRAPVTVLRGSTPPAPVQRPVAPAFSSFGRGPDVQAQSQRGQSSRQSAPAAAAPRAAAPRAAAPPPRAAAPPQQRSAPSPRPSPPAGGGQQGGGNARPHQ
jgi:hypothetical protein